MGVVPNACNDKVGSHIILAGQIIVMGPLSSWAHLMGQDQCPPLIYYEVTGFDDASWIIVKQFRYNVQKIETAASRSDESGFMT